MKLSTVFAMEFRGLEERVSKKGNTYLLVHFEDSVTCVPYAFMLRDGVSLPAGASKGDMLKLTFTYNFNFKELHLFSIETFNA